MLKIKCKCLKKEKAKRNYLNQSSTINKTHSFAYIWGGNFILGQRTCKKGSSDLAPGDLP